MNWGLTEKKRELLRRYGYFPFLGQWRHRDTGDAIPAVVFMSGTAEDLERWLQQREILGEEKK